MAALHQAPWAIFLAVMLSPSARAVKIAVDPASRSDLASDLAPRPTAHEGTAAKEAAINERATKANSWVQDTSWVVDANSPGYDSSTLAANVMDGNFDTIWNSAGNDSCRTHCNNWWIEFDLGSEYMLYGIRITNMGDYGHDATVVELAAASARGGPFSAAFTTLSLVHSTSAVQEFGISYGAPVQHVRLRVTDTGKPQGYQPYIREVLFQLEQATTTTTPSPTPSPTPAATTSTTPAAGGASVTGDPHLQNIHGERFDLMKPGTYVLINIPRKVRAENAMLRVVAEARRLGETCTDMYFQYLNVTGLWAEAKHAGGYHYDSYSAVEDFPEWFAVGNVEVKIVHGRTQTGILYLNFFIKHLGRAGFPVGGLLGEDDHDDAATLPAGCEKLVALRSAAHSSSSELSVAMASLS
ncbi:unnamed protein product [Prorocentrum cordatum]|uniref:F5/8 type C domain-containing protein n=1 Tax=Prorocentrum cordatum TaxID=2364126 RepID=A0ABN9QR50_9DINO|nr:unnamed protein product [Polarella glacialis]